MWILTGSFHGDVTGDVSFQKSKLLKTGQTYPLGRKDQPLVIKNARISKDHGEFQVGNCTEDNVSDPSFKPTLQYANKRDKPMKIERGDSHVIVNPFSTEVLQDGDIVYPVSNAKMIVKWESLWCYCPSGKAKASSFVQNCASLGINLVHAPNPHVTHHLISSYATTASIAASLLSASQFVKPEWLDEVIRLGNLKDDDQSGDVSLEKSFVLPPLSKYRPNFSPTLQNSQKVFKVWEPNEERLNMLKSYRFFLLVEKVQQANSDMRDLIQRGGASYEILDIHWGKVKWHKALVRGSAKEDQKLALVGDIDALKAVVDEHDWHDLLHEVEIFGLPFVTSETLVQAIININTSALEKPPGSMDNAQISSSKPSSVSNHEREDPLSLHDEEPRTERPRKLVRRAASRQASAELVEPVKVPDILGSEDDVPRPRRTLTRRVNAGKPVVTGLGDSSIVINAVPDAPAHEPKPMLIDLTASTPARPTRLKRRVGTSNTDQASGSRGVSPAVDEGIGERASKRHKTLYNETGQSQMDIDEMFSQLPLAPSGSTQTQSQTQTASKASRTVSGSTLSKLPAVHEEEEETLGSSQTLGGEGTRGRKRKAVVDNDAETGVVSKKQKALDLIDAAEAQIKPTGSKPPSSVKTRTTSGGGGNKLDVDTAFLKAVASTKRGKKGEDEFDRDFNNLKISRPELDRQEEEWDVVDDFGNDCGIRGNFMVILEMEVPENRGRAQRRQANIDSSWQAKPNFKKFKKKASTTMRAKVELVATEENDYGLGATYWKGGHSQSQGHHTTTSQPRADTQPRPSRKGRTRAVVADNFDDELEEKPARTKLTKSNEGKTNRGRKTTRPLFMDSDDDQLGDDLNGNDDDLSTLQSSGGGSQQREAAKPPPRTRSKKPPVTIVDDDSDDGALFKGFKGKKKRR
ncbi:hypothetical protein AX17_001774 [Amanita inopinata Kibby_2008]|nr:hypothetical protein AX17_001774 [Amanita inopinata Kibby_2008]